MKHFASNLVPAVESQIQGGASNSTILQGLQPGTKYSVSITAANTQTDSEPTYILGWTLIGPPNKPIMPKVIEQTSTTITVYYQREVVNMVLLVPTKYLFVNLVQYLHQVLM